MVSRWMSLRMLDPVALQRPQIVAVAELGEQVFEDRPIAVAAGGAELAFEVALEVALDMVVVDQGVVDVDQKNGRADSHQAVTGSGWRNGSSLSNPPAGSQTTTRRQTRAGMRGHPATIADHVKQLIFFRGRVSDPLAIPGRARRRRWEMARNPLKGSERQPLAGAKSVGKADPAERLEVSVILRRSNAD